jgi:hypothetical protein
MANTYYTPQELTAIARTAVKGRGTYRRWDLVLHNVASRPPVPAVEIRLRAFFLPKGAPKGDGSDHVSVAI